MKNIMILVPNIIGTTVYSQEIEKVIEDNPILISKNPLSDKERIRIADKRDSERENNHNEYQLILEKKSKLSANKRKYIKSLFE